MPRSSRSKRSPSVDVLPPLLEDGTLVGTPQLPPYVCEYEHRKHLWPARASFKEEFDSPMAVTKNGATDEKHWLGRRPFKQQADHRGGWIQFIVASVVLLSLVAIAIGVGVGVGMRNSRNNGQNNQHPAVSELSEEDKHFPEGTWRFETVLTTISTACTNETYRCYPYSTYSESPDSSAAIFDWVIERVSPASQDAGKELNYQILSTPNPFSVFFTHATLSLLDAGLDVERFIFSVPLNVTVIPTASLHEDDSQRTNTCHYGNVTFNGTIYTKMPKQHPPGNDSPKAEHNPKRWPYAANMVQTVRAREGVPRCLDPAGAQVGSWKWKEGGECSCAYTNFDLL